MRLPYRGGIGSVNLLINSTGIKAARDAHAAIPPRKNTRPCKPTSAGVIAWNEAIDASRYPSRAS